MPYKRAGHFETVQHFPANIGYSIALATENVRRTVVHDDDLNLTECLGKATFNYLAYILTVIMVRDTDTDGRQ